MFSTHEEYRSYLSKLGVTSLSRDYFTNPLKRKELPSSADMIEMYCTLNLSYMNIANIVGRSVRTVQLMGKRMGLPVKDVTEIVKSQKKSHGINDVNGTGSYKFSDERRAEINEKRRKTNLERYGVEYVNPWNKRKTANSTNEVVRTVEVVKSTTGESAVENALLDWINGLSVPACATVPHLD